MIGSLRSHAVNAKRGNNAFGPLNLWVGDKHTDCSVWVHVWSIALCLPDLRVRVFAGGGPLPPVWVCGGEEGAPRSVREGQLRRGAVWKHVSWRQRHHRYHKKTRLFLNEMVFPAVSDPSTNNLLSLGYYIIHPAHKNIVFPMTVSEQVIPNKPFASSWNSWLFSRLIRRSGNNDYPETLPRQQST